MTTGNKRHSPCCPPPLCAYCVPDWPSSLSLTATEAPGWTQEPQEELARGVLANWEEGPVAPLRSFKDLWVGQTTEEGHFWRSGLCGPGRCGVGVRGLGRATSTSLDTPHSPNPWYPRGQHLTNVRYHRDPAKTLWASQHQGFLEWQCSSPRLSLQLPGSGGSRTASLYLPWADHTVEGPRVGDWESWLKPEMESHCQAAPYMESNRRPTDQQSSAPRPPSVHRQEEHREILEGLHRGDWSAWTSAEAARSPTNCLCMLLVPVPAWIPGSEQSPEVEAKV